MAALAPGLKFDAQKIHILWTDHSAEQPAFESRSDRARGAARGLATEVHAVRAHTEAPVGAAFGYSGQHLLQGVVQGGTPLWVERGDSPRENFERIARKHFSALVR
jgi:hypothetical protein